MHTIRKKYRLEMGHQLATSYSACCREQIHGHRYELELYFTGDLDDTGMIIDFKMVSDKLRDYLDGWDHSLLVPDTFPQEYLDILIKYNKNIHVLTYNPTAENIAKDMFFYIKNIFPELSKVILHETETGYAEYSVRGI